jgi:hypothetical protein
MLFGFVNLSELVKYLRVERYLAAKIGTISWFFFFWWVVFIAYGGRGFIVLLGFCCLISAFIR